MTVNLFRLVDGRQLGYYEFGDPAGIPLIFFPGTPVSGISGGAFADEARAAGVRIISLDKPGYGHSDLDPAGTLLSATDDAVALAENLGIVSFAVAGESGGGPYSLAMSFRHPGRVTIALVLVGMGPGDEVWAREGMNRLNKAALFAAQRAPFLLRPLGRWMAWSVKDADRIAKRDAAMADSMPAADRAMSKRHHVLDIAAVQGGFRQGIGGTVHEAKLLARPWGFALDQISGRVELWHGTEDANVPLQLARHVVSLLPHGELHVIEGVGHAAGRVAADDVMAAVVSAAEKTSP